MGIDVECTESTKQLRFIILRGTKLVADVWAHFAGIGRVDLLVSPTHRVSARIETTLKDE
jgi:hypothetical protein